jgi:hypothetical protein
MDATTTTPTTLDANAQAHADALARRARRVEAATIDLRRRYPSIVEITAVQDLFQVHRCEACQSYVVRRARRAKAQARDKALRAAARAAKGQ